MFVGARGIVAFRRRDERSSALLNLARCDALLPKRPCGIVEDGDYSAPSIIAAAQAMCPSKPSDFAIAR
jgi:hypothetical protein